MLARTRACLLLVVVSVAIGACGSSAATASPSASSPPPSEAATPAPTQEPAVTPAATPEQPVTVYRIRSGDTLYRLAIRFKVKLDALIAANPQLADPNKLKIGERINIPVPAKPSPSA